MDKQIIDKIITVYNLKKEDCDRLLQLCDLIKSGRNTSDLSQALYADIPIASLAARNLSYEDIKMLDMILFEISGRHAFSIANKGYFEFDPGKWMYSEELQDKSDKYVVLTMRGFFYEEFKDNIKNLKNEIPENTGLITLTLDGLILKRKINNLTLFCEFEEESDPIFLLSALVRSKVSKKGSDLGGGKGKNWARTVIEINKRTQKKLQLAEKEPLIENDKGYKINAQKYHILY